MGTHVNLYLLLGAGLFKVKDSTPIMQILKHFKIRGLSGRLIKSVDNQQNVYSKTYVKLPLSKRLKIGFQDQLLLNAGQKYCRMLQVEHSAILSPFIKLPFVIKIFLFVYF